MKKCFLLLSYLIGISSIWSQDYTGIWKSPNYEYTYNGLNDILYCEMVYTSDTFESTNYYVEKEGIQGKTWGIIEVVDNETIKLTTTKYMDQKTGEIIPIENGQVRVLKYTISDNTFSYKLWDIYRDEYREHFLDYDKVIE